MHPAAESAVALGVLGLGGVGLLLLMKQTGQLGAIPGIGLPGTSSAAPGAGGLPDSSSVSTSPTPSAGTVGTPTPPTTGQGPGTVTPAVTVGPAPGGPAYNFLPSVTTIAPTRVTSPTALPQPVYSKTDGGKPPPPTTPQVQIQPLAGQPGYGTGFTGLGLRGKILAGSGTITAPTTVIQAATPGGAGSITGGAAGQATGQVSVAPTGRGPRAQMVWSWPTGRRG
jgi:hypothetical protein